MRCEKEMAQAKLALFSTGMHEHRALPTLGTKHPRHHEVFARSYVVVGRPRFPTTPHLRQCPPPRQHSRPRPRPRPHGRTTPAPSHSDVADDSTTAPLDDSDAGGITSPLGNSNCAPLRKDDVAAPSPSCDAGGIVSPLDNSDAASSCDAGGIVSLLDNITEELAASVGNGAMRSLLRPLW